MSESAKPRITSGSKFRNEHGFSAIKGWDAATGFGTPDFGKLLEAVQKL